MREEHAFFLASSVFRGSFLQTVAILSSSSMSRPAPAVVEFENGGNMLHIPLGVVSTGQHSYRLSNF